MISAISSAVSGMSAASARFTSAASSLVDAELGVSSPTTAGNPSSGSGGVSKPLTGSQIAFANSVDPVNDIATEITASLGYRANIKTFEAADQMMKSTLDLIA
jgi:flagellar basal body rod protein FlgC